MIQNMNLQINDFGPIENADINLKKLNIIAGENGSGKSTASKLLFCFLTASSKMGFYLSNNSVYQRFVNFIRYWSTKISAEKSDNFSFEEMMALINKPINLDNSSFNDEMSKRLNNLRTFIDTVDFNDKNDFYNELKEIENLLNFNSNEDMRYFNVSNILLNSEFNFSQLINFQNAHVSFKGTINKCKFNHEIDFEENRIGAKISEGSHNCLDFEEIQYIDSPSMFEFSTIFNSVHESNIPFHLKNLSKILTISKNPNVYDNEIYYKIDEFLKRLNNLLEGSIIYDSQKQSFIFKQGVNEYSIKNVASGIKQIATLQFLLENRHLKEFSFLFIDEPEINVHPKWQIAWAEILVLMVKELNISLYINSHSPQFIEALEVYSAKYGLNDDTSFYLSEFNEKGYVFNEINRENLNILYDNLGNPYDTINEVRAENMSKGIF